MCRPISAKADHPVIDQKELSSWKTKGMIATVVAVACLFFGILGLAKVLPISKALSTVFVIGSPMTGMAILWTARRIYVQIYPLEKSNHI